MAAHIIVILLAVSMGLGGVSYAEGQSGGNSTPDSLSSTDIGTGKPNQPKGLLRKLEREKEQEKECPSGTKSLNASGPEQSPSKAGSASEPCPEQLPPLSPEDKGLPGKSR